MLSLHERKLVNWKKPRRVGRGLGSGRGKTCGRGTKGQKARSKIRPGFEGGQMPFTQKIPKHKGFFNLFSKRVSIVNVADLEKFFPARSKINPVVLREKGLVKNGYWVKILGDGELKKNFTVEAHSFSKQAERKIKEAKGEAIVIPFDKKLVESKSVDLAQDGKPRQIFGRKEKLVVSETVKEEKTELESKAPARGRSLSHGETGKADVSGGEPKGIIASARKIKSQSNEA